MNTTIYRSSLKLLSNGRQQYRHQIKTRQKKLRKKKAQLTEMAFSGEMAAASVK